ncbi:hypothetical protein PCANC_26864 [Puccinia coronata f. sp. avenae]|uniref:Uncharacterized protein n=1 Tax=Puccinia coronata f. sp. avenae TaxID=200324 RepID=A0A2N5RZH1_9BASI|nr:hypothetical protein PCASD_26694 [Puccinia coronata f. sp. avenae]PLW07499.1 hypothetical protein PCANC_26864 [Puccinia coronata f. sp. avenae]
MDNHHQSHHTGLSFRDFPASRNGHVRRKLYMPNHDVQFDLEMARRTSKATENKSPAEDSEQSHSTEAVKSESIEFGLISQHPAIDEETLEKLPIPPPLNYQLGLERELRPNAIFIHNRSIALLKTGQIISHVLQLLDGRNTTFKHLEWVDDFSCVLVFASGTDAIEAFTGLLVRPDEVEGENGLPEAFAYLSSEESSVDVYTAAYEFVCTHRPAKPFSESLFEANPKNNFHRPTQPEQFIPFVRFATSSDVKNSQARKRSMFYALHGDGAGQEGVLSARADPIFPTPKRQNKAPLAQDHSLDSSDPPLAARVENLRPVRSLPRSKPKVNRARPVTLGKMDDELARFTTKTIDVKPSTDRTSRKRERDEQIIDAEEQEATTEVETTPSRKRRMPSPSVIKPLVELLPDRPKTGGGNLRDPSPQRLMPSPSVIKPLVELLPDRPETRGGNLRDPSPNRQMPSPSVIKPLVELLPDRPETRGGNLRDEIFESDHAKTDFQEAKPQIETRREQVLESHQANKQLMKDNSNPAELPTIPVPIVQEGYDGHDQKMVDVAKSAEHDADQNPSSSDAPPARVRKPEPKPKGRWGPLFSRLI